jgi:hypothetical protein
MPQLLQRQRVDSLRTDLRVLINNDAEQGETFRQDWELFHPSTLKFLES